MSQPFCTASFYVPLLTVLRRHTRTPGQLIPADANLLVEVIREAQIDPDNLAAHGTREDGWFMEPLIDTSLKENQNSLPKRVRIAYDQLGKQRSPKVVKGHRGHWGLSDVGLAEASGLTGSVPVSTSSAPVPVSRKSILKPVPVEVERILAPTTNRAVKTHDPRLPPVGTVIRVEKRQKGSNTRMTFECKVLPDGVLYEGVAYPSLSGAAAKAATTLGLKFSSVNGYAFFGLCKRAPAKTGRTPSPAPIKRPEPSKPPKNATSIFLEKRLAARGSKLWETMERAVTKKLPVSVATGQIEDHIQNCLMQLIARDALKGRIDSGEIIQDHHIATWAVRSAYKDIRNAGTEPVTRELHGARTERERLKKIPQGELNDPRVVWKKGDERESDGGATWADIEDVDSSLSAQAVEDMIHFEQVWGQVEDIISANRPQAGDRYLGILKMRADGMSVKEIAEAEGVSPYRATSLVAEARRTVQKNLRADVLRPSRKKLRRLMRDAD